MPISLNLTISHFFSLFHTSVAGGALWPVQGRGAGQDDRGGNGALRLCEPLCASLLRFWGRGAIPTFPPLPRRLWLPGGLLRDLRVFLASCTCPFLDLSCCPSAGLPWLPLIPAPASPLHRLRGMCCGVGEYLMLRGSYQMVSR